MSSYDGIEVGQTFVHVHENNSKAVGLNEKLWSSIENRWIPCCGIHVLISKKDVVFFANSKGCFHARVDDAIAGEVGRVGLKLLPRHIL